MMKIYQAYIIIETSAGERWTKNKSNYCNTHIISRIIQACHIIGISAEQELDKK